MASKETKNGKAKPLNTQPKKREEKRPLPEYKILKRGVENSNTQRGHKYEEKEDKKLSSGTVKKESKVRKLSVDEEKERHPKGGRKMKPNLRISAPAFIPSTRDSGKGTNGKAKKERRTIVQVWKENLQEEIAKIMEIVDKYPYVAMDTEFPGVVARPTMDSSDYHYQTVKCNADILNIIQLGLCFCDEDGNVKPGACTWQFNFKFDLGEDTYAQDSIELLSDSGVDFEQHRLRGINAVDFAALVTDMGLVLNEDIHWISFHSAYDFAYLLKLLTGKLLPKKESDFFEHLKMYFPSFYDVKYLIKYCENINGGLETVAQSLGLERIGPQHQAGSDALLTGSVFFHIKKHFFDNLLDDDKHMGVLYGLGQSFRSVKEIDNSVYEMQEKVYHDENEEVEDETSTSR